MYAVGRLGAKKTGPAAAALTANGRQPDGPAMFPVSIQMFRMRVNRREQKIIVS